MRLQPATDTTKQELTSDLCAESVSIRSQKLEL